MVIQAKLHPGELSVPDGTGRRERRREETSEKLFIAAIELFSRKGFAHTRVEEITQAADVGKGTFFNYFPSKEHVLGYLVTKQHGTIRQHLLLAREGKTEIRDILLSLARDLIRVPGKSPQMARSLISAFLGNIEVREYIARELSVGRNMIAEIISLGQERGELRREIASPELARVFQHVLFGTVLIWALDTVSSLDKQFSNTMQVFFSGLGATSKPAARVKSAPAEARRPKRVR